jgi:hypothetical protein
MAQREGGETMGLFSDHFRMDYEGHVIEVETRTVGLLLPLARFALIIDNRRVEDLEAVLGWFSLRGQLESATGTPGKPIAVRIRQGLFGTKAFLEVDQQSLRMPRV